MIRIVIDLLPLHVFHSNVVELIILHRYNDCLTTSDNQFSFKAKHSTDMYTFVKKHIGYYMSQSRPIYLRYVDASKSC